MTPWHPKVVGRFGTVPDNPRERDFYGPFNKLLHDPSLFSVDSDFAVALQRPHPNINQVGSSPSFVVTHGTKPVFVLQINDPRRICDPSARRNADLRMRTVIQDLIPSCPLPTLDGVCTFGTKLCFYRVDQQTITLPFVVEGDRDEEAISSPLEHWICDVLERKGADQLNSVVRQIKETCEGIPW
ncbi:hypothetical protein BD410DRAFT_780612 [Rickenella mellea]|uniref:Uncharacterized protein n=1 Tax=Rickenella mellea TaxID=50990 RepID=A0A4R5XHZ4_9AGAM|nr:hypothetical protein BD410DRAFT_780612 [Rickenella mellea]